MHRRMIVTMLAGIVLSANCLAQARPTASVDRLPAAFVPNVGQWHDDVLFAAPLLGGAVQVRRDGLWLRGGDPEAPALARLTWDGVDITAAGPATRITPVHIFGPGAQRWTDLPGRTELDLHGAAPGVALHLAPRGGTLHMRFEVPAGELPLLRLEGGLLSSPDSHSVTLAAGGVQLSLRLRSATRAGQPVDVRTTLVGETGIALLDDPGSGAGLALEADLVWSTFLGGSSGGGLAALAVLQDKSVVVAGGTFSLDFPVTPNAAGPTATPDVSEGFLSRLSADGSTLLYSTYLTSTAEAVKVRSVCTNGTDRAAMIGFTQSVTLPTTPNAYQPMHAGSNDGFIAEYDLDTGALEYCSYLGTVDAEVLNGGAYGSNGTLYLAGKSTSPEFPTTSGAYQQVKGLFFDGIIVELDTSAAPELQLQHSTILGTSDEEDIRGLEIDSDGSVLVFGPGGGADFPITPGAYDPGPYPNGASFVSRLDGQLSRLIASTFLPNVRDIAVAADGSIAFCSRKTVPGGATPGAFDESFNGSGDVFVGLLSPDATTAYWTTYLGGSADDTVHAIDIDATGAVVVTGQTSSLDFPVTPGAFDVSHSGGTADPFVSILTNQGTTLGYSTFLGPSTFGAAFGEDVEFTGPGEVVVGGKAVSPAHPSTPGAYDETFNDIFIAKLSVDLTWADLGQGLAGTLGVPNLAGSGELAGGSAVTIQASRCLALSTAWFVLGLSKLELSFKGGTLVPSPDVYAPVPVNGTGQATVSFTWPAGIPAGVPTYYQVWVVDPGGPKGFSASNGLQGLSQ